MPKYSYIAKFLTAFIIIGVVFFFSNIIINSLSQNKQLPLADVKEAVKEVKPPVGGLTSTSSSGSWLIAPPANAQEIVEMRTQNSKTWLLEVLPDGRAKLAWEGSIGAIHYKQDPQDPTELWKDIITDIVRITNDESGIKNDYDYKMDKAEYSVYFKDNFNEGKIVRYEKGGEWLEIKPGNLNWNYESGIMNQEQLISEPRDVVGSPMPDKPNHIYWSNAYGGKIDFEWVTAPQRLTKFLIIENFNHLKPANSELLQDKDNLYLELNLNLTFSDNVEVGLQSERSPTSQNQPIEFQNKQGQTLWYFSPLKYWDSAEPRNEGVAEFVIKEIRPPEAVGSQQILSLSIRVPYAFLQSALFPVYIDLDLQVGAGTDNAREQMDGASFQTNGTWLNCGSWPNTARWNSGVRFQAVTIDQGSTINIAYSPIHAVSTTFDDPDIDIYTEAVDNSVDFATTADVTSRVRSAASTSWIATGIGTGEVNSPSIVGAIQERISSGGWINGNALTLIYEGKLKSGGVLTLQAFNLSASNCPKLHIEYTAAAGSSWQPRPGGVSPSGGGFMMF